MLSLDLVWIKSGLSLDFVVTENKEQLNAKARRLAGSFYLLL
jgi:hypothetical protein